MDNALIWAIVFALLAILVSLWIIFKKVKLFIERTMQVYAETDQFRDSLKSDLSTNFKSITERLDQQQLHNESIPRHNSTFYFNAMGEAMNLNIESWSLETEQDHKELIKDNKVGVLTVYVRKNKIIFDRFVLDFKNFSEKHADYLIVQHGVKLMKNSELNITQLHFEMLKELIVGVHAIGTIYHHHATNLFIYSFIQHVKPLYEAEKAQLEKEAADKKDVESETSEVRSEKLEADQVEVKIDPAKEGSEKTVTQVMPEGIVYENALVRAILCTKELVGGWKK